MSAIDFSNSYHTFFGAGGGNNSRHLIEAACTVYDETSDWSETYYLVAWCRGERMYLDADLFQMPNYEFGGIWSAGEHVLIRRHWASDPDYHADGRLDGTSSPRLTQFGKNRDRFKDVHLDICRFPETRKLSDYAEIAERTLANVPLVARTELRHEGGGLRAVLEYPLKTMNVLVDPPRFQVDTGPLIVPDFGSTAERAIERFNLAYVAYNAFDRAEFILRKPRAIGEGGGRTCWVTDYSVVQVLSARNEILCPA